MQVKKSFRLIKWKPIAFLIKHSKKIVLPGFEGLAFYDVFSAFIKGIKKESITARASSISFTFFLALFPGIIFFFTIIPYIPINNFQDTLLDMIKNVIPENAYGFVNKTLIDIIKRPRGGLLSVGFIMALYFSTNGINRIIQSFNQTYHLTETRTALKRRLISIILVVILSFLIIIAITLITSGTSILNFFVEKGILKSDFTFIFMQLGKWIVIISLFFFSVSFLYYLGPTKKMRFRFISPGSTLATILIIITSFGFNFYINNFSRYNALYGSIGTLIIVLLWIYFNAIILLIGFELNASISDTKLKKEIMKKGADKKHP